MCACNTMPTQQHARQPSTELPRGVGGSHMGISHIVWNGARLCTPKPLNETTDVSQALLASIL
jgi:hypothetical protein